MNDRHSICLRLGLFLLLPLLLIACEQDLGDPCQNDGDCASGLCCLGNNARGTCESDTSDMRTMCEGDSLGGPGDGDGDGDGDDAGASGDGDGDAAGDGDGDGDSDGGQDLPDAGGMDAG